MTFMNREDPAEPDEPTWPAWAFVTVILVVGGIVAVVLLYRGGGSLFGLDDATVRALALAVMFGVAGLSWWLRRRARRA